MLWWNGCLGRGLEGTEPQEGRGGRVLEDQRTLGSVGLRESMELQNGWGGKVLEGHRATAAGQA